MKVEQVSVMNDDVRTSDGRDNDDVTNGEGGTGQCNGSCTTQDWKKSQKAVTTQYLMAQWTGHSKIVWIISRLA